MDEEIDRVVSPNPRSTPRVVNRQRKIHERPSGHRQTTVARRLKGGRGPNLMYRGIVDDRWSVVVNEWNRKAGFVSDQPAEHDHCPREPDSPARRIRRLEIIWKVGGQSGMNWR